MQKVIIGSGIPGAGKTTILKKFAEKYGYTYISSDTIRTELTNDVNDMSKNDLLENEIKRRSH